ncbi:hypothetical protein V6N13_084455 [Hibiscus sabdariffa]
MSISRYLSYALPWSYFFFVASETWPVALDGEEESKRTDRGISLPRLASSTLVQIQPYFPPVSGANHRCSSTASHKICSILSQINN